MVLTLWWFPGSVVVLMVYSDLGSTVVLRVCGGSDLLVDDVDLEDSCSVVRKHPAVEEELGQSKVDHPVILSDHRVNSVVRQRVVWIREVKEHPLQRHTR